MTSKIQRAWAADTAHMGQWDPEQPAKGQCAVTALLVQELLGGGIVKADFTDIEASGTHYWNMLPNGQALDLTQAQFTAWVEFSSVQPRDREHLLRDPDTFARYKRLKDRLGLLLC